jgi:hypothetical protein
MNAATTESLTREAIARFLTQLTDEQKRYALLLLIGPVLGPIKEKRAVHDVNGRLLGDYLPIPKVQPGQKVGMTDEEREALSKVKFMSLAEWRASKAQTESATSAESTT